jgi:hypothetical protein
MTLETQFDQAVKAVCPISGVSFGNLADKATWVIQFKPEATAQQIADAEAVKDAFIYTPDDPANLDLMEKSLKALGLLMRDYCNQLQAGTYTNKTVNQLKADFKVKFDALA